MKPETPLAWVRFLRDIRPQVNTRVVQGVTYYFTATNQLQWARNSTRDNNVDWIDV